MNLKSKFFLIDRTGGNICFAFAPQTQVIVNHIFDLNFLENSVK
jgi:hypothetical protein